jgi:hypothetical protein
MHQFGKQSKPPSKPMDLLQSQVTPLLEMDTAQLSKIEKGKSKRYLVQQASTIKI